MKLGVVASLYMDLPLDDALKYLTCVGFEAVELYCGQMAAPVHCDPDVLLNDPKALQTFKDTLDRYGMTISQLNCSGNAVSPIPGEAEKHRVAFEKALRLAEALLVDTVGTFSGCPGGGPKDETPNWITCPWPDEFTGMLRYQWEEVLIPYWEKTAMRAKEHGVERIALEMHPGFCVYNPHTLLKLREAVGPVIGANFDPSHLFWQGIDIQQAIFELNTAIFHMHAKDTRLFDANIRKNGILDTKPYSETKDRAWIFGTVGFGHGEEEWRKIIDALTIVGYNGTISIEHEDALKSKKEGLEQAYRFLKTILPKEKPDQMWWA